MQYPYYLLFAFFGLLNEIRVWKSPMDIINHQYLAESEYISATNWKTCARRINIQDRLGDIVNHQQIRRIMLAIEAPDIIIGIAYIHVIG